MVAVGIVLIAIAAILLLVQRSYRQRAFSIKSARPAQVSSLQSMAQAVAAEIGGGDWREYVRLWGTIRCNQPLISELKQVPCVYYRYSVRREYEETRRQKNAEGHWETITQRGSETLSSHQQSVPFQLVDTSGAIEVNPAGADIETIEVVNDFRPDESQGTLLFGRFRHVSIASTESRRTLGYRYQEAVLPLDRSVLVVGEATDSTGAIIITKPEKNKFIISPKSYDDLARNADTSAERAFWGAMGCAVVGGLLVLIGWLV